MEQKANSYGLRGYFWWHAKWSSWNRMAASGSLKSKTFHFAAEPTSEQCWPFQITASSQIKMWF